jgi:uncharacterized protein
VMILVSGLSGSGKTWLAERLAPLLGAVHLRSDVERKRLTGLQELDRSDSAVGEGIYARSSTNRVYEYLTSAAEDVLLGGYIVIIDATFARREYRDLFRKLARRHGVPDCLIQCRAPDNVLVNRIIERASHRQDASEADVKVLTWQKENWEPIAADESGSLMSVDTTNPQLDELARQLRLLQA